MQTIQVFKIETFGAVDGPGVRLVIFTQGCNFRCKYCHNPESWSNKNIDAKAMSTKDIVDLYERNKPFYENGGITLSGGEPMLHPEFILELASMCKAKNIHLAIDTSASTFISNKKDYEQIIDLVDLWIVDVKATNLKDHQFITGCKDLNGIEFIKYLESKHKPYWLRQVILKGFNDSKNKLDELINFIKQLKYIKKWELLSYHTLGLNKYNILNIKYQLNDTKVLTNQEFDEINDYVKQQLKGQ